MRATKLISGIDICIESTARGVLVVAVALGEEFGTRKYKVKDGIENIGMIIMCGGNVDVLKIASLIEQEKGLRC